MKNSVLKKFIYLLLFTLPFLIISISLDFKVFFINIFFIFLYLIFVIISEKNKNYSKKYIISGIIFSILSFSIIFLCYYIPIHIIDFNLFITSLIESGFSFEFPIMLLYFSVINFPLVVKILMVFPLIIVYLFFIKYFISYNEENLYKISLIRKILFIAKKIKNNSILIKLKNTLLNKKFIYLVSSASPFLFIGLLYNIDVFIINLVFVFLYLFFINIAESFQKDSKKYIIFGITSSLLSLLLIFFHFYVAISIADFGGIIKESIETANILSMIIGPLAIISPVLGILMGTLLIIPLTMMYYFTNDILINILKKHKLNNNKINFSLSKFLFIPFYREIIIIGIFKSNNFTKEINSNPILIKLKKVGNNPIIIKLKKILNSKLFLLWLAYSFINIYSGFYSHQINIIDITIYGLISLFLYYILLITKNNNIEGKKYFCISFGLSIFSLLCLFNSPNENWHLIYIFLLVNIVIYILTIRRGKLIGGLKKKISLFTLPLIFLPLTRELLIILYSVGKNDKKLH